MIGGPTKHSSGKFKAYFFGHITDANLSSSILTKGEAISWILCENTEGGDLLHWRNATWKAVGLRRGK